MPAKPSRVVRIESNPIPHDIRKSLVNVGLNKAYISVKDVTRLMSVTEQMVRHWIATNAEGFRDKCVKKRVGKVFIKTEALIDWIERGEW